MDRKKQNDGWMDIKMDGWIKKMRSMDKKMRSMVGWIETKQMVQWI